MNTALIICTYMRPLALKKLLNSVSLQVEMPTQIIVVDGSTDHKTKDLLDNYTGLPFLYYFLVGKENRGLTRQRNFGVNQLNTGIDIVCFLDDDLVIEPDYFQQIQHTYFEHPNAVGVGGIDLKENRYFPKKDGVTYSKFNFYELDGWVVKEPLRYKARKLLGLMPLLQPDIIPPYSHGRSGFPPSGKTYQVDHFIGCSASFKNTLFDKISFSKYFEGYGLYEDFDFCVRALKYGELYVNTNANVWHYHDPGGRPDHFKYGKMVVRNGWYVWRSHSPGPSIGARFKWHAISLLLASIRLLNAVSGPGRMAALQEAGGRFSAWVILLFKKPGIKIITLASALSL